LPQESCYFSPVGWKPGRRLTGHISYNVSAVATSVSGIGLHSFLLESVQDSFLFLFVQADLVRALRKPMWRAAGTIISGTNSGTQTFHALALTALLGEEPTGLQPHDGV